MINFCLEKVNHGSLKRAYDYLTGVDGEDCDDDEDADESSYGMIKKVRSADNSNMKIMRKAMRFFFKLISDYSISEFLKRDACCLISDKVATSTQKLIDLQYKL